MTLPPAVILASKSPTRRAMLTNAGVVFSVETVSLDEEIVRERVQKKGGSAADAAAALAEAKAAAVSVRYTEALVIGADQILDAGESWLGKPVDRADAEAQLQLLSGRPHHLVTAVCLMKGGKQMWRYIDRSELVMQTLDAPAITRYLDALGARALESVGAYQVEGLGAQLFSRINGDHFAILGLPLLPLLDALRQRGSILP